MKDIKDGQSEFDLKIVWALVGQLRHYYRLFGVLLAVFVFFAVLFYLIVTPTFTAVAVLGPPGPSPTGSLMSSLDASISSGLSRKLLGAGNSSTHDSYQDLLQLLPSSRLARALIERDHILQTVFAEAWDPEAKRWKPRGILHQVASAVKRPLNIPITEQPDVDTLMKFFAIHLVVTPSKSASSSSILSAASPYMIVTFTYKDPHEAERLLNLILAETDRLVREDQQRDVSARIAFLRIQLSHQDIAAFERNTLTSILSDQEQLQTMLQADQRYASTLVVPPYASLTPTSPPPITKTATYVFALSLLIWIALVYFGERMELVRRLIAWSKRKEPATEASLSPSGF